MINRKDSFRAALDRTGYALPVAWAKNEDVEKEQVESLLHKGDETIGVALGRHPTQGCNYLGSDVNWRTTQRAGIAFAEPQVSRAKAVPLHSPSPGQ